MCPYTFAAAARLQITDKNEQKNDRSDQVIVSADVPEHPIKQQNRNRIAANRIPAALFIRSTSFRFIVRKLPFLTSDLILTTPAFQNNGQNIAIGGIGNAFEKRVAYCFQRRKNQKASNSAFCAVTPEARFFALTGDFGPVRFLGFPDRSCFAGLKGSGG